MPQAPQAPKTTLQAPTHKIRSSSSSSNNNNQTLLLPCSILHYFHSKAERGDYFTSSLQPFRASEQSIAPESRGHESVHATMGGGAGNEGMNYGNLFDMFGGGRPTSPPDNRPPEERYAHQLQQLNEMGFYDFDRNIQALRRTGGSVNGAIEYLLNNPQ